MRLNLEAFKNLKICVAVSGGRDSMTLLHYLINHGGEYGISVCALNCDHKMRENSARDSKFVRDFCRKTGVPLQSFEWDFEGRKTENSAREWRQECYLKAALKFGADAVATAHHLDDNAETVLFNLARGSALSGLTGIAGTHKTRQGLNIIRPLISTSRREIDEYIAKNQVPFVDDETNFSKDYTRNKIRLSVLPELESAVPGAAAAIGRFSRLAAEDEEYFEKIIAGRGLIKRTSPGAEIAHCDEKVVFKRAALRVISEFCAKDYTSEQLQTLYELQFADKGKRFEFLNLIAFKEEGKIAVIPAAELFCAAVCPFDAYIKDKSTVFCGQPLRFMAEGDPDPDDRKVLKFDRDKIPEGAVIRTMREGDVFRKFGGGRKSLGDFFTDKKIPVRLRGRIPLVACGSEILIVCGVEISDGVKVEDATPDVVLCAAEDYLIR